MRTTTLIPIVVLAMNLHGQAGALDNDFSSDGILTTTIGSASAYANAMAIQTDGKILVAGSAEFPGNSTDFTVVRYFPDGSLDTGFGENGTAHIGLTYPDEAKAITIQPDGKILLAGFYSLQTDKFFAVARLNADGTNDAGFGLNGQTFLSLSGSASPDEEARGIALQADGKIVVAGPTSSGADGDFGVARFNTDGSMDNSFSFDGQVVTAFGSARDWANSVALQSDGRIVVAGYYTNTEGENHIALARYQTDGQLDSGFGSNGLVMTDITSGFSDRGRSVRIAPDGKILCGGFSGGSFNSFSIVRYMPSGAIDTGFGVDGIVTFNPTGSSFDIISLGIQSDGKVLACGNSQGPLGFILARFMADGTLDTSFGENGWLSTPIEGGDADAGTLALQQNGRILIAGSRSGGVQIAVARYLNDIGIGLDEHVGGITNARIAPNPMTTSTLLRYELAMAADVSCDMFDALGRKVHSVLGGVRQAAGPHTLTLPKEGLISGTYMVLLRSDREVLCIPVINE